MSEEVQIADDDSCATKIRRIGDEIHNLSCRHQNDDDLSGELGSLSFMCWAYSKEVAALKEENERLKARVAELEAKDPNLISECGCRFENDTGSSVLLCEACSELPCHNPDARDKGPTNEG